MRYRKLDKNGDFSWGRGQSDLWRDVPDAPAQAVLTRLRLNQGDWFLDLREGIPMKTRVLGKHTGSTRDPVMRARILGTEGVTGIVAYGSQVNRETRAFGVQATIDTRYGRAIIEAPL